MDDNLIRKNGETLVRLLDVPNLPEHVIGPRRQGKKLHKSTVIRWATFGLRGVRLETVWVGGTRYTSVDAIRRFSERLARVAEGHCGLTPSLVVSPAVVIADHENAERELEAAGV